MKRHRIDDEPEADGRYLQTPERIAERNLRILEAAAAKPCRHDFRDGDICSRCDAMRSM